MMIQPITSSPAPSDNSAPSGSQKADGTFQTLMSAMKELSGTSDKQGKKAGSKSGQDEKSGTANTNTSDASQIQNMLFIPLLAGGSFLPGIIMASDGSAASNGSESSGDSTVTAVSVAGNSQPILNMATVMNLSALVQTNQNPLFAVNGTGTQKETQSVLPVSGMPESAPKSVNPVTPVGTIASAEGTSNQILLLNEQPVTAANSGPANSAMIAQSLLHAPEIISTGSVSETSEGLKLPTSQNSGNEQAQNIRFPEADSTSGMLVTGGKQSEADNGTNTDTGSQNAAFSDSKQPDSSSDKTVSTSLHAVPAAQYMSGHAVVPVSDESSRVRKPIVAQVSDQITANLKKNTHEFQVDLYPESLGKVSVKLSMENNVLTVKISADDAKTQSLLLSQSDRIQSMLQNTTNQTVQVVPQDKQWYEQSGYPSGHSQQQQQQQQQNNHGSGQGDDQPETEDFLSLMQRLRVSTVAYGA